MSTEIRVGENEGLENALKRFKRKVQQAGIIGDMRRKEEYMPPSVRRKKKSEEARKKLKKEQRSGGKPSSN